MTALAGPAAVTAGGNRRLRRDLHPGAWWVWALGMATAATTTSNPLLLGLAVAVMGVVVSARRGPAPWARGFGSFLMAGLVVVVLRIVLRVIFDGQTGGHVLFRLPEVPLPEAAAGVRIGGPVSLEGVLAALYDGLRLAVLLLCVGAANSLANPKRLLAALPGALAEVGVSVTVALTLAPQLVESARRVRRARRLRGAAGGRTHWFRQVAVPVLTDALDRSLLLAAAMDSRGYGRTAAVPTGARRLTGALVLVGLGGVCVGTYGLLDATTPALLGVPMLAAGLLAAGVGAVVGGRRVRRTRYRPDPWRGPEWAVAGTGVAVAAAMQVVARVAPSGLTPSVVPLRWPELPALAAVVVLVGALPAVVAPPPRLDPGGDAP